MIALDHLTDLQKAQILHFRPDLHFGFPVCQRCHNGQVIEGQCLMCSTQHDEYDNLIAGGLPADIRDKHQRFHQRRR